ncbi:MAG: lipocalin-like domain-containing protein [Candidatus Latescibacteria bacterium]|nr:lipocalin-like domain-containing protein [Candidatus Latescibacterota bacterium]
MLSVVAYADEWKIARPGYQWSFPQDHWARVDYKTEWWYFTGHLEAENGRRFGYQFTFFRVGILPEVPELNSDWGTSTLIMGHAAISDLDKGKHYFSEVLYRVVPMLSGFGTYPDTLLAWSRGPTGTEDRWTLSWNGDAFDFVMGDRWQKVGFALTTKKKKPMIFQGPNGYSRKGEGESAASQYYSFTRLATEGNITIAGESFEVTGESWMDKEFGSNQLGDHQVGWDWFSLQLADGREIMLYILRGRKGQVDYASGTVIGVDGSTRYLDRDTFEVEATAGWKSRKTGALYPARWTVTVDGKIFIIESEMDDQENIGRKVLSLFYWEGAVKVMDRNEISVGKGYVELTGYGNGRRPGI